MSVEENLGKVDTVVKAFSSHDWDSLVGLFAESAVLYASDLPEPLKGRDAIREGFQDIGKAFPDVRYEKERAFGQGDWVCMEFTMTGTHKGPVAVPGGQSIPATNRSVRVSACEVLKFEGGQIVEVRAYYDLLGFMTQLGLAP